VLRFHSFGDIGAKTWAGSLHSFCQKYESRYRPLNMENGKEFQSNKTKPSTLQTEINTFDDNLKKCLISYQDAFTFVRYKEENCTLVKKEIALNPSYYDRDTLISYKLTHGLPDFQPKNGACIEQNYGNSLIWFLPNQKITTFDEHSSLLLTWYKLRKPVIERLCMFYETKDKISESWIWCLGIEMITLDNM